jgi:hypothetical protein
MRSTLRWFFIFVFFVLAMPQSTLPVACECITTGLVPVDNPPQTVFIDGLSDCSEVVPPPLSAAETMNITSPGTYQITQTGCMSELPGIYQVSFQIGQLQANGLPNGLPGTENPNSTHANYGDCATAYSTTTAGLPQCFNVDSPVTLYFFFADVPCYDNSGGIEVSVQQLCKKVTITPVPEGEPTPTPVQSGEPTTTPARTGEPTPTPAQSGEPTPTVSPTFTLTPGCSNCIGAGPITREPQGHGAAWSNDTVPYGQPVVELDPASGKENTMTWIGCAITCFSMIDGSIDPGQMDVTLTAKDDINPTTRDLDIQQAAADLGYTYEPVLNPLSSDIVDALCGQGKYPGSNYVIAEVSYLGDTHFVMITGQKLNPLTKQCDFTIADPAKADHSFLSDYGSATDIRVLAKAQ